MDFNKKCLGIYTIVIFSVIANAIYANPFPTHDETSTTEIAKKLANPISPLATLTLRNEYTFYSGNLPHADHQSNFSQVFYPFVPFQLNNGDRVIFRPTVPFYYGQPEFKAEQGQFEKETGLGDIQIDLNYGHTQPSGLLLAGGVTTVLPTATSSDIGEGQWTLGPRGGIGVLGHNYVAGIFATNQWKVAGWNTTNTSVLTLQPIASFLPGQGRMIQYNPTITYDWSESQWTLPIDIGFYRTVKIHQAPWRFGLRLDYYAIKPASFGPKWMLEFDVAPVVQNVIANWFSGKFD